MLEALATRQGQTLRVVLIHKDPANPARLSLDLRGGVATTLRLSTLSGSSVWDTSDQATAMQRQNRVLADATAIDLPAASVSLLTIDFAPRP
jgi:preprotein translocase subunit SecD